MNLITVFSTIDRVSKISQASMEYVEEHESLPPQPTNLSGSVAEAKRVEIKRSKQALRSRVHNTDRVKDKLKTKLRQYDRHKKSTLLPQSSMDWLVKQDGMLFDFGLFGLQCCMVDSFKTVLPFALSLLSRYIRMEHFERAREIVMSMLSNLECQAGILFEGAKSLSGIPEFYAHYKGTTVWATCKKLYVYVVTLALNGVEKCNERDIMKLAEKTILKRFEDGADVVMNIVKLLRELATNFYQCVQSGRWSDFFHSEDTYTKWYNDNLEVERIMNDLEIPNDAHEVIERTKQLMRQGEEILTQMRYLKMPIKDMIAVSKRLQQTRELYAKFTGTILGTQLRRQPFCIFVNGRSKIGKSSFMKANHLLYAKLFGKDASVEPFMRQPGDRFWDGYQNNQWALTYDDVSAFNPNKVMGIDEFHKEILHVSNCMAKLAECAAIEDKGTKPLLFDLIQVSSNVDDLNAHVYYEDTAALIRRLQHRVTLRLRPDYIGSDGFLDPKTIPKKEGFPEIWYITIQYAITEKTRDGEVGRWADVPGLKDISTWEYMQWFKKRAEEHVAEQNAFLLAMKNTEKAVTCPYCNMFMENHPEGECYASQNIPQAGFVIEEDVPMLEEQEDDVYQQPAQTWSDYFGSFLPDIQGMASAGFYIWLRHCLILSNDFVTGVRSLGATGRIFARMSTAYSDYLLVVWSLWLTSFLPLIGSIPLVGVFWCCMHPFMTLQMLNYSICQRDVYDYCYRKSVDILSQKIRSQGEMIRYAGELMFLAMGGTKRIKILVAALTVQLVIIVAAFRYFTRDIDSSPRIIPQGALQSSDMLPGLEPENVWRRRDYRCNVMDVPLPSSSLKGASEDAIVYYFQRSLVRISFLWKTSTPGRYVVCGGTGFFLGGNDIFFVSHFLDRMPGNVEGIEIVKVRVQYYTKHNEEKVATAAFDIGDVTQFDDQTSIINFPAMPVQKAMDVNIPSLSMLDYTGPGLQIGRQSSGGLTVASIRKIWSEEHEGNMTWVVSATGTGPNAKTEVGDCGSLLLALTPRGPVLVGIHMWLTSDGTKSLSYNLCGKKFPKRISSAPPFLDEPGKVGNLCDLHPQSPIRYLDDLQGLDVLGSFDGFRARPKSKVTKTMGADFLMEKYQFGMTHGRPVMQGREVKWRHVQQLRQLNASIPTTKADLCCAILIEHVMKSRKESWKAFILSQKDAINGVAGVRFLDRIPISTSVGFPFRGPKTNFIQPVVEDDWTSELRANDVLQDLIDRTIDRWRQGLRAAPVFTASLKDEARSFAKIEAKNTRVFFGGPAAFIIAQRQIFSWFTRVVQTNPLVFMQAPGMDANGSQWNLLAKYLLKHDNFIAGDFKDFDISMVIQILRAAYKFIITLGQRLGATDEHVAMMTAASEDLINPVIDYFGDLVVSTGKNPSGQALTVHVNGVVNALYMLFCYLELHPGHAKHEQREVLMERGLTFFDNVRAIFYGDDNLMSVSEDAPWFNHTSIARLLKAHDVVYTMAEKGAESQPYIPFSEVTFLKRKFRFEEAVKGYVAPLEESSITKALLIHIPSGMVSDQEAYAQTIAAQNDAMWHHGQDQFEQFRGILLELIAHCGIEEYFSHRGLKPLLADWEELTGRWLVSVDNPVNKEWSLLEEQSGSHYEIHTSSITHREHAITRCARCGRCPFIFDDEDERAQCSLCGGCLLADDPWCINCQEDGFCGCGRLLEVTWSVARGTGSLRLYLSCEECDMVRIKEVPLTRTFAHDNGLGFPEV